MVIVFLIYLFKVCLLSIAYKTFLKAPIESKGFFFFVEIREHQ